jgi:aspartyl-tRNA(Asn)/glutamyl-tRNA(Gln) amidotransferase subunit C
MEEITQDLFNHLVELAALELTPSEAEYLRTQLNHQLVAVHELGAIPLAPDTLPAAHGVPYPPEIQPAIRHDQWRACENPAEILAQAPETQDGYIVVPEIPHTDLA